MRKRRQASIIVRMNVGFALLVALFAVTILVMQRGSNQIHNQLGTVTTEALPLFSQANQTSVRLLTADKIFKDFLTTRDPARMSDYDKQFTEAHQAFKEASDALNLSAGEIPALAEQLAALQALEKRYFEHAHTAMANYQTKLVAERERSTAIRRFQVLYGELSNKMQSYINDSDNIAVQMISKSYFVKLEQTEETTSDALASNDPSIVGTALRDNKKSVTQLNYAFNGIVRQDSEIGETFQASVDQYTLDIGQPQGILEQHYNYLIAEQELYDNILTLAQEIDAAMAILNTFVTQADQVMADAIQVADTTYSQSQQRALLLGLLAVTICATVGWYISTRIRAPLHAMLRTLEKLTQGDMTQRFTKASFREFEQLSGHINTLATTLQEILRDLGKTSDGLTHVAEDNQAVTAKAKQQLKDQGERTASVAAAMTEMDHSVKDVSNSAEHTMEKVKSVEKAAGEGRAIMSRSISTTQQLSTRIDESVHAVGELQKMSHNIGAILDVIRNIADQTNLLALNAAIEAARAGEQGRGFAVVADEVRVLASKTTDSTEEIEGLIQTLQNGSAQAVNLMESCVSEMATSSSQASDANSSMEEVLSLILEISEMSSQISQASNEQSNTSSEIAQALESISHIAETNYQAMEQVAAASENLDELAHKQNDIVSRFVV
ncbi:methyl-accepting chemotaxis protein [Thaumasiovibrio subtropicus]|uniref:methyl-accepting chemotaxis protein n=1 Tax=Thaumasiovibrio subtropicus TaxID=1891207 RepID=UPI000B357959|nr:methyl-accepting chemotaxis protein [Thaumasiovibrio subtropicus]